MSALVTSQKSYTMWAPPETKPLDEAVWQAWVEKGRARDRHSSAVRLKAVEWVSLAGLAMLTGLWSGLAPYEFIAKYIVAAGALVVMSHAIHAGHYASAVGFGAIALLCNPLVPVLSFTGSWTSTVVFVSALPFVASLTSGNRRRQSNA